MNRLPSDILIIDDQPDNLRVLSEMFKSHGYRVRPVTSCDMATMAIDAEMPDIILLDIRMPGISGYDFCQKLKSDKRTAEIPVIFISALEDTVDKVRAFDVGGVDYITKPFNPGEVLARVQTHLSISNLQRVLRKEISQRQQAEEELRRHKEQLESQVAQRTRVLEKTNRELKEEIAERHRAEAKQARLEEQLRQSQKMEVLGQLAGGVAHDFNNLLAGIMGNAQLLAMKMAPGQPGSDLVAEIEEAANRAADMTKQLLTFSRKDHRQAEEVDLHESISAVVSLLKRSISKQIEICQELDAAEALVMGDRTQLQSALLNLCVNARDAMPGGGVLRICTRDVTLDAQACSDLEDEIIPGQYVEVEISDTGVGMSEEMQQHIFEPFFTTKPAGEGTGLGLAAVYGCIQNHHGVITVKSQIGKGSTFRLLLPLAGRKRQVVPLPVQESPELLHGQGHVLIVDDEEIVRNLGSRLLEELGYKVSACSDGASAVQLFQQYHDKIDLVILDMIMPKMGGQETFMSMKDIQPDVHVLFLSGQGAGESMDALLEQGACGFLNKPFRINELSQQVSRCIRRRGQQSE